MATGTEVLEYYGLTVDQGLQFIETNIGQPEVIFNEAYNHGITTQHLSDITGYSTTIINDYFVSSELNSRELDEVKKLFNSSLGELENLVSFNDRNGFLSNVELGTKIETMAEAMDDPIDHESFFSPYFFGYEEVDSVLTPDELGVSHLGNVPATTDSIKSLVYGSLINLYSQLDETELRELKEFPHDENNRDEYRSLLIEDLKDSANYTDLPLADLVANESLSLIEEYGIFNIIGVLDHSILGLAGEL